MSDPLPVPDCYRGYETWMQDLARLEELAGIYQSSGPGSAADTGKAYLSGIRRRRSEAFQRRDLAHTEWLENLNKGLDLSNRLGDATRTDPHCHLAGTRRLKSRYEEVTSAKEAAWGEYKAAQTEERELSKEIDRIEQARSREDIAAQIAKKKDQIRGIVKEAHQSLTALMEVANLTFRKLHEHEANLAGLSGARKTQMLQFTMEGVRNAAERIGIAADDLVKYRAIEGFITLVGSIVGVGLKRVLTTFAEKAWIFFLEQLVKQGIALHIGIASGVHDVFMRRGMVGDRSVMQYCRSDLVTRQIRTRAKAMASEFRPGGATELGARLLGDQYAVLEEAYRDMLYCDLVHTSWFNAIDYTRGAIEQGRELKPRLDEKIESWSKLVARMDDGVAALTG